MTPDNIDSTTVAFLTERHLATLTTLRADGSPHVVPVGFTYDTVTHVVSIITFEGSVKVRNADRGGRAAVSQVDGGRWLTLEGTVTTSRESDTIQRAVRAYATRYREPKDRPDRVVVQIHVDRILGRA